MYFITRFLVFWFLGTLVIQAQPTPPVAPAAPFRDETPAVSTATQQKEELVDLLYPNATVDDILSLYERLTGLQLVRDANLAGANISISVPEKVSKTRAIQIIEASLLLNGYAFVPAGENLVKVLNTTAGKQPRAEGTMLYANASALPEGDAVVSYFMQLRYITPDEALPIFQAHVPLHPYGAIIPIPTAQAVLVTESAAVIRQLVTLRELIDVPPSEVVTEFVQLKRANAERVAEIINQLLEARRGNNATASRTPARTIQPASPQPQGQQGGQPPQVAIGIPNATPSSLSLSEAQVLADPRTNRIILMSRPLNMPYLKSLVNQFDEAVALMDPFERPLRYMAAKEALPVLGALLAETTEEKANFESNPSNLQNNQTGNRNTNTGGSGSTSGTSLGVNMADALADETASTAPESINVGSTTLIADNRTNSILVLGPPESRQKVSAILDKLDKRPLQVYLSTVIGQLTVGNGQEFGVDLLQKFATNSSGSSGMAGSLRTRNGLLDAVVDPSTLISADQFPLPAGLTMYGAFSNLLDVYLKALEDTHRFRVLSRPSVYTTNNRKAEILSGQKVAVPTSTLSSLNNSNQDNVAVTSNIQYQDVVLKLEVVPLINSNHEITLGITQKNDSVIGEQTISGNTVPTIGTQQITTSVTVPNRSTIMLGGLVTDSKNRTLSGIPFLQRIPLLGYAFRQTKDSQERSELIVLLQPTVVETPSETIDASYEEQNRMQTGREIEESEFTMPPPALPVKTSKEETSSAASVKATKHEPRLKTHP